MQKDSLPPRKRRLWFWVQVIGGVLAVLILFWKLPLRDSLQALREARPLPIIVAGVSLFAVHLWTWIGHVYLLRVLRKPQPVLWFLRMLLMSQVLGMLAPGKIGDLSIAWFLKRRGVAYGEGLAIGMFYKMVALAVALWLGVLGLLGRTTWEVFLLMVVLLPGGLFLVSHAAARWIIPALLVFTGQRRLAGEMRAFNESWKAMGGPLPLAVSLLLGLFKALLMTVGPWLILMAFNHPVPFFTTLLLSSAARVASSVPISPAGLGVRELSGTVVFSQWAGVPWAVAANMMLISTLLQYLVAGACYGFSFPALASTKEEAK